MPPAVAVVPAVVAALVVGGFLIFRGGGHGALGIGGGRDDTIPAFNFSLAKTLPIPANQTKVDRLRGAARPAAVGVRKTLTALYKEAFLDPGNWRDGSYDNIWLLFDGATATAAQGDAQILTLGAQAGDAYESVQPGRSKLVVKVLMDRTGKPSTAVGIVRFTAHAAAKDGKLTAIVSTGQYFLQATSDGWQILSYEVDRADHPEAPKPGPSVTPTAAPS